MGDPQRGDDALYFYAANLGRTRALSVSTTPAQTSDVDGALRPGRYLLLLGTGGTGAETMWVAMGAFKKGGTLSVSAGVPHFPMHSSRVVSIEVNVRKGDNDRVAAVMDSGTNTLYITQISRDA